MLYAYFKFSVVFDIAHKNVWVQKTIFGFNICSIRSNEWEHGTCHIRNSKYQQLRANIAYVRYQNSIWWCMQCRIQRSNIKYTKLKHLVFIFSFSLQHFFAHCESKIRRMWRQERVHNIRIICSCNNNKNENPQRIKFTI